MKKTKEEILADEIIKNPVLDDNKKLYIHCDKVLSLMQEYADQETSTLYTRAQMIELGEKVRKECLDKIIVEFSPFYANMTIKSIQEINIENLLNK